MMQALHAAFAIILFYEKQQYYAKQQSMVYNRGIQGVWT